jgi:hypothetical protein
VDGLDRVAVDLGRRNVHDNHVRRRRALGEGVGERVEVRVALGRENVERLAAAHCDHREAVEVAGRRELLPLHVVQGV